jgi:peptidyl-prolyl cis-trans isomerase B (cyclophilin B)
MITLKTNMGDFVIELDHEKAPKSCENFEQYVRDGHYDGTIFHDMTQKATRDPIENEAGNGLSNVTGSVAMARTSAPHSATAQFFINVKDNGFLDHPGQDGWGYCVFGKITSGMDVVEKIKGTDTTSRAGHSDVPFEPIVIEKAEISE